MSLIEPVPQREPLAVLFSARTDTGQVRAINEDNFLVDRRLRLYVVCDGLGGHQSGEVASATAVNLVREGLLKHRDAIDRYDREREGEHELLELLGEVVREVSDRIYERGRQNPTQRGMGTTMSLLLLSGDKGFIAHVGDTRIYRHRAGALSQVTEDHSLLTEMQRNLQMTPAQVEALDGRLKNQITRAVGVGGKLDVDVFAIDVRPGDRYLLCSDGLHGLVPTDELAALVAYPDLVETASRLVDAANAEGGRDNITAIVVQIEAPSAPDAPRPVWPIFEVMRATTLFQGLSDLELASIIDGVDLRSVAPSEALVTDTGVLPGLFVVLEGELQALRSAEVVAVMKRGDFFAEDALVYERTSGSTVIGSASGASVVLVERRHFEELQRTFPNVALKLAVSIARALARKVEASAREGSMRLFYRDPATLTRPVPRPATSPRVLADTEPEYPARRTPATAPLTPTAVMRRARGADRRSGNAVTHPSVPVMRGPSAFDSPPPLPTPAPADGSAPMEKKEP